ncbi:MAG: SURF1 family protein [Salaquimonas sp.]
MRLSTLIIVASITIVMALLIALGTWQVNRLHWKELLIERVELYLAADPQPVSTILQEVASGSGELDYRPTNITGIYLPDQAFLEFTTHNGRSGWNQFAVLNLRDAEDGSLLRYAFVNRGFIPFEAKDNWQSVARLPSEEQKITGLLRVAPASKPGSFMPDNLPLEKIYYWRDLVSMATSIGLDPDSVALWYVDEGIPGKPEVAQGAFPISGTTIISFSNNHLQYAVTWYGLALALFGVGGYFLYVRRANNGRENEQS